MSATLSTTELLAWRDGLVRALASPREGHDADAQLVNLWPAGAVFALPESGAILYLVMNPGDDLPPDDVAERITGLAKESGAARTHVAIVGGGPEVRELLERVRPGFSLDRSLACHHVTPDGGVWSTGGGLDPLKHAARQVADTLARGIAIPALLDDEVVRLREGYRRLATQQARFVSAIRRGTSTATMALVAVNALVFLLEATWGGTQSAATHFRMGANAGDLSLTTEPWRLFASAFLHAGLLHVGLNMMSLLALGPLLERLVGPARFLVLYLASALGGAIASAGWLAGQGSSVGASGAIFGLLTATVGLTFRRDGLIPAPTRATLRRALMTPLISSIAVSMLPGIDFAAHGGGALVGFLLAGTGLLTRNLAAPSTERKSGRFSRFSAGFFVAIATASIALALLHGRPWELVQAPDWQRTVVVEGVSLEIPSQLDDTRRPASTGTDGVVTRQFGALGGRDPLSLEVRLIPLEGAIPRTLEREELESLLSGIREGSVEGLRVETQLVDIQGRPAIVQSWTRRDGVEIGHAWWVVRGARLVHLTAVWPPSAPEHWKADWGRFVRSLEVAGDSVVGPVDPTPADPTPGTPTPGNDTAPAPSQETPPTP